MERQLVVESALVALTEDLGTVLSVPHGTTACNSSFKGNWRPLLVLDS